MIECGSVRCPLTSVRPIGFDPSGTTPTGIHHASRMFDSIAPAFIAMSRPSPVLVSIDTGCDIGPRRNARRRSSFHSKPPDASTTPFVAATSTRPSGVSTTTPTTAPSTMSSSVAAHDVRGSIPRSRHARSNRPASACPQPRSLRRRRRSCSSADGGCGTALPSGVSLIVM
jgi:hypothetical protein